jgi:pimeloyl-ACP methyl ester carboxylesterase
MTRRSPWPALFALTALAGGAAVRRAFRRDLALARARLRGRSSLVSTRFGTLEYAERGAGPPVLMVHGTGGGFDQGLDMSGPLADAGWRVIAPSRFGYLRSAMPPEPSSANQADAFADLLDRLSLDRVAVIGGSAGALSAIEFAIRHPARCSALVALVPAAYAPGRPPVLPPTPLAQAIIDYALRSDGLFWAALQLNETALVRALLATDAHVWRGAAAADRERVRAILGNLLPVSDRARGFANDARLAGNPQPQALESIRAPTLALSLEDDRFETAAAARHIAASVRGARLVLYPTGGHVWIGHHAGVFAVVDEFLRPHSDSSGSR